MIGDGQRVAIIFVAQPELALVVGAPQVVGLLPRRQWRTLGTVAFAAAALDQTMPLEHGVNGAARGNPDLTGKAAQQAFADLACAPVRLLAFQSEDGGLDLLRQLVAIAPGPARTVRQGFQTRLFVAVKDLVAGFARDSELPAKLDHRLAG